MQIFGIFDTDCDGFITREELTVVLGALGVESSGELVDTILLEFDENQDGQIQFVELVKYLGTGTSASSDKLQHHVDALKVRFTAVCVSCGYSGQDLLFLFDFISCDFALICMRAGSVLSD